MCSKCEFHQSKCHLLFRQNELFRFFPDYSGVEFCYICFSSLWDFLRVAMATRHRSHDSPEVVIHRFKKEFKVGFVQDPFEVRQGDALRGHVDSDQVGGVLVLHVVNNPGFRFPHPPVRFWRTRARPPRRSWWILVQMFGPVQQQQVSDALSILRKSDRYQNTNL